MGLLGGILIFLALPLFIGYAISDPKKNTWRNLAIVLLVVGLLIIIAGSASGL